MQRSGRRNSASKKTLREKLDQAERRFEVASKAVQEAERERKAAEQAVASTRAKLDRIA